MKAVPAGSSARTPVPRPQAMQPETTAQLWGSSFGLIEGAHRPWSGSPLSAPTPAAWAAAAGDPGGARGGLHVTGPRAWANGHAALPACPAPYRGGAGQTRAGPEGRSPRTPTPPPTPGAEDGREVATHSGCALPRARARLPQVPRSLTQSRRLRRAQRPGRRNSPGAGGGGWPD